MHKITSRGHTVTKANTFKEALRSADNARIMRMKDIKIKTPKGEMINYSN